METVELRAHSHQLEVLRPSSRYARQPAMLLGAHRTTAHIRQRFAQNPPGRTPGEGVAVFNDATIFGPGVICLSDGQILTESLERPDKPPAVERASSPKQSYRSAVHVAKRGNSNYGHFLVEMLPRLVLNRGAYPNDAPILLHRLSQPFARPILKHAGIEPERVQWIGNGPVLIERLHWPTRNTFHPLNNSPHIFPCLRALAPDVRAHDRLFIGRRDATTRQLVNEDEIFAAVAPLGFHRLTPGHMSFEDQVRAFASARVVVAVVGAALTNMVFMPPGGTVVMLQPATAAGFFFWDLAHHCRQRLVILWGDNVDPGATDKAANFSIDVREFHHALSV